MLTLPTYAATAFYHHKLPNQPAQLEPFLTEVEQFAMGDYWSALAAGGNLPAPSARRPLPPRCMNIPACPKTTCCAPTCGSTSGVHKTLQGSEITTGRLDSRFSGPTIDPMSREAEYDPQAAAIQSAYASAFNDYVRSTLGFGQNKTYKAEVDKRNWEFLHQPPEAHRSRCSRPM